MKTEYRVYIRCTQLGYDNANMLVFNCPAIPSNGDFIHIPHNSRFVNVKVVAKRYDAYTEMTGVNTTILTTNSLILICELSPVDP